MNTTQLTIFATALGLGATLFANHVNNTCYSSDIENQRSCPLALLLPKPIPSEVEINQLREEKARLDAEKKTIQTQMMALQKTISDLKQGENEKNALRKQLDEMQRQLSKSQQTEVERAALRQQVTTLQQKLTEMHVTPPQLPKPPPADISVSLPLTVQGKVDFEAIFSPLPPVRDSFEKKEEFATRLKQFEQYQSHLVEELNQVATQHDLRVQAGIAQLEKQNYNVDKAEFVVQLTWADWIGQRFVLDDVARVAVVRDVAKSLFEEGPQKPVFVTLQTKGAQKTIANSFLIGLGKEINLLMTPPKVADSFRDKLKDGSWGPELVWIPSGTFPMGSTQGSEDEKPVHVVTLKSFALGKYEVTFDEYDQFCEATEREKPSDAGWGRGKRPVINVTWDDAKAYTKWLSEQTGKDYRLPTESQWEYACRAGNVGKYTFGDDVNQLGNYGWYDKNSEEKTHPVGEKKPNAFGLYDMHGNVWEWLEDVWHSNYEGAPNDGTFWGSTWVSGGESNKHLLHGGSSLVNDDELRCANRHATELTEQMNYLGFRLSRM